MSRLRLVAAALALGAILLVAAPSARAWTPIDPSNPVWALPVPYSLNQAGSPDLGGFAASEAEVRRAMDDWTRVSCTSLRNAYQGSTTRQPGSFEGTSTIGWVESGWRYESQAIGVTTPAFGRRGIAEADMALNGVNFTWTTASGSFNNVNAYSIILHEGGHYYGLGHTNVAGSTMWPSYSGGIVGLGPDDQNGICALYPGSGSDCTTTGCPSGQECVSGTCQAIVGDGMICSACSSDSDCGGPSDLCIRYPNGRTYCGRSCSTSADCSGDTCASLSGGGRQCARVVGSNFTCEGTVAPGTCTLSSDCPMGQICTSGTCTTPASGAGLGEPCTGNMECSSMLCLGGSCTQSCDSTNVLGSCPGEFYCDADSAS
ncbi:MAG: matrixin family metalloprotease, partial [Sandaracinaceae bacterium]